MLGSLSPTPCRLGADDDLAAVSAGLTDEQRYAPVARRALVVTLSAAAFGAADQCLGSRGFVLGSWATQTSLLPAPWLLVAFVAGWSQPTLRRAAPLGLVATFVALVGYWVMTLSPLEGAQISVHAVRGLLFSQSLLGFGALLSGPLFGWLGYRWRAYRDPLSALAIALAVCLEPLAHAATGTTVNFRGVWAVEMSVGFLAACVIGVYRRRPST